MHYRCIYIFCFKSFTSILKLLYIYQQVLYPGPPHSGTYLLTCANQQCSSIRQFYPWFPSPALSSSFSPLSHPGLVFLFSFQLNDSFFLLCLLFLLPRICPFCVFSFTSSLKQLHQSAFSHLLLFLLSLEFSCSFASLIPIMVSYCNEHSFPTQFSDPGFSFHGIQ